MELRGASTSPLVLSRGGGNDVGHLLSINGDDEGIRSNNTKIPQLSNREAGGRNHILQASASTPN